MKRIRKNKRNKIINILIVIFVLCCLTTIIYASYNLIVRSDSIDENEKIKAELSNYIEESPDENKPFVIDFTSLKKQNSDTVAYLKVNNTNINYVVVKASDNKYYLDHNFNKEYNTCGWIYADYRNNIDELDKNIIIYGHNMRDGSMFGSLSKVIDRSWQQQTENRNIILMTEEYTALYEVFSTYLVKPEDYYISTDFASEGEYQEFLKTILSRSNYNYNVDISNTSQILTLSSCNATGSERIVLHAKKIN